MSVQTLSKLEINSLDQVAYYQSINGTAGGNIKLRFEWTERIF